jgi:hypothetical protein
MVSSEASILGSLSERKLSDATATVANRADILRITKAHA